MKNRTLSYMIRLEAGCYYLFWDKIWGFEFLDTGFAFAFFEFEVAEFFVVF
jgi:hypothetical protein